MTTEPEITEPRKNVFKCFDRRYLVEIAPALFALALVVVLKRTLPRTPRIELAMHGLLAVTMGYTVIVTVAAIRRLDELQRRIQLVAIAVSFAATGVLVTSLEFLTRLGLPKPEGPELWIFMTLVWVGAALVLGRRYR